MDASTSTSHLIEAPGSSVPQGVYDMVPYPSSSPLRCNPVGGHGWNLPGPVGFDGLYGVVLHRW